MASLRFLPVRGSNIFADGLNVGLPYKSGQLPMNTESGDDINFGGVRGAIAIMNSMDAVELKFTCEGIQPELLKQFGAGSGIRRTYTLLGALVDELADDVNKRAIPVQATCIGRLSAEMGAFEGGAVGSTEYTVKSITKYTLQIGGEEICRFDLVLGGWLDAGGQQIDIAQTIGLNA